MNTDQRFNVQCRACDQVWSPGIRTSIGWRAKNRDNQGFLDALCVSGEDCGCVKATKEQEAPYRVFGFNDEFREFDIPFNSFTAAVNKYRDASRSMCTVFISGVSPAVEARLNFG